MSLTAFINERALNGVIALHNHMSEKGKSWFLLPLNEEQLIFPLFTNK